MNFGDFGSKFADFWCHDKFQIFISIYFKTECRKRIFFALVTVHVWDISFFLHWRCFMDNLFLKEWSALIIENLDTERGNPRKLKVVSLQTIRSSMFIFNSIRNPPSPVFCPLLKKTSYNPYLKFLDFSQLLVADTQKFCLHPLTALLGHEVQKYFFYFLLESKKSFYKTYLIIIIRYHKKYF